MNVLNINSENDAWDLVEKALAGKLPKEFEYISFGDWPSINFKLNGNKFKSSLTPSIMKAIIQLQTDIFRAYARLNYDSARATALTDTDKLALEIQVIVSAGSTKGEIDLQAILNKMATGAISKMEAKHYIILACIIAATYGGTSIFNSYLQHQKDIKQIEAQQFASHADLRKFELLAEAKAARPELVVVHDDAQEFYNAMLKGAVSADSIQIAGHMISGNVAKQMVVATRERATEKRIDGDCRILKVDSSKDQGFMVEVLLPDGRTCVARLEESFLATREKNKELIKDAEWGKHSVHLSLNARELRGDITTATIIDVRTSAVAMR